MIVTTARVLLFGTHIGSVAWDDEREVGIYEYDPDFLRSGIEIAPLKMPLGPGTFAFPELSTDTFKGLPGLLADCLPDKFGNLLIDRWLAGQGRTPESFNPVERLCFLGARGMGALEFEPNLTKQLTGSVVDVAQLVELANEALADRVEMRANLEDNQALTEILRVGTSAGGARAKAIVAWNPTTNEVRSGQVNLRNGFEAWLIKFDGVSENRDKEIRDPKGYGRIEYAYHLMARAAGITMSDCHLFEENGRAHFMTRRFDRTPSGDKLHQQTLCGINHMDFNRAGDYSYEQAFQVARRLSLPHADQAELYRRAVFNIFARNQDDHTKNLSFLMDRLGTWHLAPAYDVIYSYNPSGAWTSRHQMSLAGKRDHFTRADLLEAASAANVKAPKALKILAEVAEAVREWGSFAENTGVEERQAELIGASHRRP